MIVKLVNNYLVLLSIITLGFLAVSGQNILRYIKVKKQTDLVQHANHNHNETVFL